MPLSLSPAAAFESRIASRQARVGIIGMGYVGLPLTLCSASSGFRVTGFDVDAAKVEALNAGGSYIVRIPGPEIVKAQDRRLPRHRRLRRDRRDGRHHHLRAHAARRVPRARPELHRADGARPSRPTCAKASW